MATTDELSEVVVDFGARKTEWEWQVLFDLTFIKLVPEWFKWVTWAFVLGALKLLHIKTGSIAVGIIMGISHAALLMYFNALFFRLRFVGFPRVRSSRLLSLAVSGILAGLAGATAWQMAGAIAAE